MAVIRVTKRRRRRKRRSGLPLVLATIKIYGREEGPFKWVSPVVIPPDIPEDE